MFFNLLLISILLIPLKECSKPGITTDRQTKNSDIFYFGADLSYVNQVIDKGGVFRAGENIETPYKIFKDHGANIVRVRLWHNPAWIQGVYGSDSVPFYSGLADVEKTIRLAKEQGMQVELDFHYSDTWADPGKQEAPLAWKDIKDVEVLKDSIYQYTFKTLEYLLGKDLMPEWVQIGNETNCGLFHTKAPEGFPYANGCKGDWKKFGDYLNAGIKAVRDVAVSSSMKPKIILHVADPKNIERWFDSITTTGKVNDFDVIGFSYYPLWHTAISLDKISDHISKWKKRFNKDVMIVETAYPWTIQGNDQYRNAFGSQQALPGFPFTEEGQYEFLITLTQEIIDGGGTGIIYWEPAWITSSMKDLWGTGSSWENAGLFDFEGKTIKGIRYMKYSYRN